MGQAWTIISILCLLAAAIFLWRDDYNTAFVVATLGAVAWFLSYRVKLRAKMIEQEERDEDDIEAVIDQDE